MTTTNLKVTNLNKVYRNGVKAIANLNLEIGKGMFGLLGPNGAGKSSLMRTIATLQSPDSGSVEFEGIDVLKEQMALRKVLGYLPQEFGVYPRVSAEKLLDYFATLKGVSSKKNRKILVEKALEITNLYDVRKKHVSGYSGGMKQRFGIAQLLLNNPKLIIVDEPTAGLDPAERQRFLNILREVGTENTVIFSTHIVEDVKELCHEMAIMNQGRILQKSTPEVATANIRGQVWTSNISRNDLEQTQQQYNIISSSYNRDNSINIRIQASEQPNEHFSLAEPNLEDVYFIALQEN
ncbi:MAG: ABC transporter ATP-binding protein [Bacteroidota bacterium]